MSKHLPYPGRYESFNSWDFRCKQWEGNRRRSQSRGLSGRPDKRYIEGGRDGTEEKNVRIAGIFHAVKVPMIEKVNGKMARIFKRGYGYQNSMRVRDFAEKKDLLFEEYNGNGCQGMCERTDGIAFKYIDAENNP